MSQATTRIGIWGAASSGKTTYLAALRVASLRPQNENGRWMLYGDNGPSKEFLAAATNDLNDHHFPPQSEINNHYVFKFKGDLGGSVLERGAMALTGGSRVEFVMEVIDCPGRMFDDAYSDSSDSDWQEVLDHIAKCDGILYLCDPLRDDNFKHFQRTLDELAQRADRDGRFQDMRLNHFVAVCVTKFDDPRVFETARAKGLVARNDSGRAAPRIPDDRAREFFECVAGDLVPGMIDSFFDPKRVKYFVCSAIGFRAEGNGRSRDDEYSNVRIVDGSPQIVGSIRPINILEPLVWLDRQTKQSRPRSGR